MDDFEEMSFLSPQQNANLKSLFEYYSEHETRRRKKWGQRTIVSNIREKCYLTLINRITTVST